MRAVQSRSTAGVGSSGTWCRTEQFAALRYVSRYLATDAAVGPSLGPSKNDLASAERQASWVGASRVAAASLMESADPERSTLARDAETLLQAMQYYNNRLADAAISSSDWSRYTEELACLRNRSEALMERFLRGRRGRRHPGAGPRREGTQQESTTGWIAC